MMEGRTDVDRYNSSCRKMLNYVAAPQGPAIGRSGTVFVDPAYLHARKSSLIPFVYDQEDSLDIYICEFAHQRVRFFTEDGGILVRAAVDATVTDNSPFVITSSDLTGLGAGAGHEVVLMGFPNEYNLNYEVVKILSKVGDDYTLDFTHPALAIFPNIQVYLVYHINSPYEEGHLETVRDLQSLDTIFCFNPSIRPKKLIRTNTYSWAFSDLNFMDGPYLPKNITLTTLTPSAISGSGVTVTASATTGINNDLGFLSTDVGRLIRLKAGPRAFTANATNDQLTSAGHGYTASGQDSVTLDNEGGALPSGLAKGLIYWIIYVDANTVKLATSQALAIAGTAIDFTTNGTGTHTLVRNSTSPGTANLWTWAEITARNSATEVVVTIRGESLTNASASKDWRLGAWSGTTGWPNCATFYQDRLACGGSTEFPDFIAMSEQGLYESFSPSNAQGTVLDENGFTARLNSRRSARLKWMVGGDRGLMMGTGGSEYVMTSAEGASKPLTPSSAKVEDSGTRGSTDTDVLSFGAQVLFVQRFGRQLREFAFVYEADGYKAPSMNLLANHLGISPFVEMAYASEPHSIVWVRRANGTIVGMTYNRDENVVGWHRHDISGGVVESIAVIPSSDQLQDTLWMVVRRTVNGQEKRYIERLTRFWDFDMTIEQSHFVDCALRYQGEATDVIFGAQHLEGREDIYGLADGIPIGPLTVTEGAIVLDREASDVIIGLGYEAECETSALENGAQDGTAQGKVKRMNGISVNVWESYGGEVGTYNEDQQVIEYTPLDYPQLFDEVETINLFSGIIGPIVPAPGYWKRGSIFFRRPKNSPLPFNVTSLMPQMNTQDRG